MRLILNKINELGALLVVLAIMTCSNDYNPFSDPVNAKVVILPSSFSANDTIDIFGNDTLKVSVAAIETADSITIDFGNNRHCSDTTLYLTPSAPKRYSFVLSYYKTGQQTIEILTHRKNGKQLAAEIPLVVKMPLLQKQIAANYDNPIQLKTPSVKANDVLYLWDFGTSGLFSSPFPETTITIVHTAQAKVGSLWVSEIYGSHASPKVPFNFNLDDKTGPLIVCVNEGYVNKDTIEIGASTFPLRFSIADRGLAEVFEATINGKPFDIVEDRIYIKVLDDLDTLSGYQQFVVQAIDDAFHGNTTSNTFYVGFDPTKIQSGLGIKLAVLVPPHDSLVFSKALRPLHGVLRNYTGDSIDLDVSFLLNGAEAGSSYSIRGKTIRNEWNGSVSLANGINTVQILAKDQRDSIVADTSIVLFYDQYLVDSLPLNIAISALISKR